MAEFLAPKTTGETVRRVWAVPVDGDDAPASVTISATGVTVDSSVFEGNDLVLVLSGGEAAKTGTITAAVTTDRARVLVETLYVPVVESPAQIADTARQYIEFALRRVVGIRGILTADEMNDGLERLSAMLAYWRETGADIGAPSPLMASSVIYCPDYAVSALRYNLAVELASLYGAEPAGVDLLRAQQGLQLVKSRNLPADREAEYF